MTFELGHQWFQLGEHLTRVPRLSIHALLGAVLQVSRYFIVHLCGVTNFILAPKISPVKPIQLFGGWPRGWIRPYLLGLRDAQIVSSWVLAKEFNQVSKVKQEALQVAPRAPFVCFSKAPCRKPEHLNLVQDRLSVGELAWTRDIVRKRHRGNFNPKTRESRLSNQ
jgi:hypothetical protein